MSEDKNKDGKKGSLLGLLVKILIFLGVFVAISLTVLASLGGSNEVLKETVEDLIGNALKGSAQIETLHAVHFYPNMSMDVENVTVYKTSKHEEVKAELKRGQIAFGFWDIALSNRQIKTLNIEEFKAPKGAVIEQSLYIEQLSIIDEGDKAYLKGSGEISGTPFSGRVEMKISGDDDNKTYTFQDSKVFKAALGNLNAAGRIENYGHTSIHLQDLKLTAKDATVEGDLKIFQSGTKKIGINGRLNFGAGSTLNPDLEIYLNEDPVRITGSVTSPQLQVKDIAALDHFSIIIGEITSALDKKKSDPPGYNFSGVNVDGHLNIEELKEKDVVLLSLKAPVALSNGHLKVGPIDHSYNDMDIEGDVSFDTAPTPAELDVDLTVTGWDYKALQQAYYDRVDIDGQAELKLDLKSQGNNEQELKQAMTGEVVLIAGEGQFPAGMINFWGGGLLNALLPELDPSSKTSLNCAVVDFKLNNGVATSQNLFLDTKKVTVAGEGTYNWPNDSLELTLTPKPKSLAIGDISSSVNINGSLFSPDISVSKFGLLKKLGGIVFGMTNPAVLALTLTDFGLNESHPCYDFLNRAEEEQAGSKDEIEQNPQEQEMDNGDNVDNVDSADPSEEEADGIPIQDGTSGNTLGGDNEAL